MRGMLLCTPRALQMLTLGLCSSSYGSGFARSPDVSDCGWNLNRLNENPENVLRAVGSCLPGVTRCALPHVVAAAAVVSPLARPQALAVHGHALRHVLLAQGGPQLVQHQLLAPWGTKKLVWHTGRLRKSLRAGAAAFRPAPVP